jgi:integrase
MSNRVFPISGQTAFQMVRDTARRAGLPSVRPHDLRRTCAKLARAGGAPIEQIQHVLGHASVQTTERYLGSRLELAPGKAATDFIEWPEEEGGQ